LIAQNQIVIWATLIDNQADCHLGYNIYIDVARKTSFAEFLAIGFESNILLGFDTLLIPTLKELELLTKQQIRCNYNFLKYIKINM